MALGQNRADPWSGLREVTNRDRSNSGRYSPPTRNVNAPGSTRSNLGSWNVSMGERSFQQSVASYGGWNFGGGADPWAGMRSTGHRPVTPTPNVNRGFMPQFTSVVGAGPGWTRVLGADQQEYTLTGARNWRNNNPGNIEYGPFARRMGAIGTDGRFAVFPTYGMGRSAKESWLFDKHKSKTVREAISIYAPPNENDTGRYTTAVSRGVGISPDAQLATLTPGQRQTMMDAMQRVEGFRPGRIEDAQGNLVMKGSGMDMGGMARAGKAGMQAGETA